MGQLFLDDRGQALRATWHAAAGVVVLSIWRAEECVGTVRLDTDDARRLGALLDEVETPPRSPGGVPADATPETPAP